MLLGVRVLQYAYSVVRFKLHVRGCRSSNALRLRADPGRPIILSFERLSHFTVQEFKFQALKPQEYYRRTKLRGT
jgi:hypothetical protein